jgi:hypothetical protein
MMVHALPSELQPVAVMVGRHAARAGRDLKMQV